MSNFEILKSFIKNDGNVIICDNHNKYEFLPKTSHIHKGGDHFHRIMIMDKCDDEAVISMAHEYGHYLSCVNGYWIKHDIRNLAEKENKYRNNGYKGLSFLNKINSFVEEILAWGRAYHVLRCLKIKCLNYVFIKTTIKCIYSYFVGYFVLPYISN